MDKKFLRDLGTGPKAMAFLQQTGFFNGPRIYTKSFSNSSGKIDATSLPSVREFERRLRDTGRYSRNEAKFYASMYGKQVRQIKQNQNGWEGLGVDDVEIVKDFIINLKNGVK